MLKEIFRGNSFRRSKRKKDKEVHWADLGGGELAKLSYISLDDSTLNLSDLESEPSSPSDTEPSSPAESDESSYSRVACNTCPECEKLANSSSLWDRRRSGTKTSRRRRKRYESISGPAESQRSDSGTPKIRRGSRSSSFSGNTKFKISAAAVFLKKIRRGPLGMCVTCGPHLTQ